MHTGQQRGLEANDRYKMLQDLYVSHLLKAKKQKKIKVCNQLNKSFRISGTVFKSSPQNFKHI